ncbi:MAG: glycosyltransferase family 39 protein [Fusobacterium perfoetens]|uniref:ArnT family glycosyltransferase n=1 Tax=Fusobacterium perfoetens TaxID=852 RepID=UPI0023F2424F|nr:glycosyltransferase family 39 protein [Fusobacterium perfoetens]MCI6152537.1 glycosyltransferase family 39 protein [Fusobacterium perfoetens]MDY3237546.1 glycosyltransferase family 39 protein [Fusobacterium perfoetens]
MLSKQNEKIYLSLLGIVSFISFFINLGIRPVGLMEARNFITAREMVLNNNFLIPTLNGMLRFEKPPFPTWLTAIIMKLTENFTNQWILRIPVGILGIIFIFLVYYFIKNFTENIFLSFLGSFVASTTFMIIKVGNENTWDMFTYVLIFGSITFFIKGLKSSKTREFIFAGIFLALSIMSKGPVGIYGLFIPFLLAHIFIFGLNEYKKNLKNIIIFILVGIVLALIWPSIVYFKYPDFFLSVLKKEENTWMNSHKKSLFYYLDYFIYMGIWLFFSISLFLKKWSEERNENKNFSKLIFFWNILVIVFLSIIKMKKKRYGIPIFMVSSIGVGNICYYYYNLTLDKLKKSDRFLLNIQNGFILLLSCGLLGFIFITQYLNKNFQIKYTFLLIIFLIPFIYFSFKNLKDKKEYFLKYITLGSGIFFLIVYSISSSFISKNFVDKQQKFINAKNIKEFVKASNKEEIYSDSYGIMDVWRVGKEIEDYKNIESLPEKLIFFSDLPEDVKENYTVLKKDLYFNEVNELVEIYFLEKNKEPLWKES